MRGSVLCVSTRTYVVFGWLVELRMMLHVIFDLQCSSSLTGYVGGSTRYTCTCSVQLKTGIHVYVYCLGYLIEGSCDQSKPGLKCTTTREFYLQENSAPVHGSSTGRLTNFWHKSLSLHVKLSHRLASPSCAIYVYMYMEKQCSPVPITSASSPIPWLSITDVLCVP